MFVKGYKIRIYPTKDQEQLIWKHMGACRFVWNYMLNLQNEKYKNNEKHLSGFEMINLLKTLKQQKNFEWLRDVSADSLQRTCLNLSEAYNLFF